MCPGNDQLSLFLVIFETVLEVHTNVIQVVVSVVHLRRKKRALIDDLAELLREELAVRSCVFRVEASAVLFLLGAGGLEELALLLAFVLGRLGHFFVLNCRHDSLDDVV